MPGFGIEDDELKKLFAEAGDAVKKVTSRPASGELRTSAPATMESDTGLEPAAAAPVEPALPPPSVGVQPVAVQPVPSAMPTPTQPPMPQPPVQRLPVAPAPVAAATPTSSEPLRILGGEQDAEGLTGRTADGQTVRMLWNSIRALTLGRVGERQWLAFASGANLYFFSDDNVAYKGLLKSMQASTAMNWRGLAVELAAQVGDQGDAGIAVLTGGGGSIPKYLDRQSFWAAVTARI